MAAKMPPMLVALGSIVLLVLLLWQPFPRGSIRLAGETSSSKKNPLDQAEAYETLQYILYQIKLGTSKRDIERALSLKPGIVGNIHPGGRLAYDAVYVIDDDHEAWLTFDGRDNLIAPGLICERNRWLRFPNGGIVRSEGGRSNGKTGDKASVTPWAHEMQSYRQCWELLFDRIKVGWCKEAVEDAFPLKSYYGGRLRAAHSDEYDLVYVIDDFYQARFKFDVDGRLVAAGELEARTNE